MFYWMLSLLVVAVVVVVVVVFSVLSAGLVLGHWQRRYGYWQRRHIRGPSGWPLWGNMQAFALGRLHYGDVYARLYDAYPTLHYVGIYRLFNEPAVLVRSQPLLKALMIRHFAHFEDNSLWIDPQRDPSIVCNPFVARGEQWRRMRAELVPNFTPNKLKYSMPHIIAVCAKLDKYVAGTNICRERFDAKQLSTRYTLDVVASVGFGIDGQCLATEPGSSELCTLLEQLFQPTAGSLLQTIALLHAPRLGKLMRYRYVPLEVQHWLHTVIRRLLAQRLSAGTTNPTETTKHNDFVQWLIEARQRAQQPIDAATIVGHCTTFLLEGFETSATLMAFALYELARNPIVQARLHAELDAVWAQHAGVLSQDALSGLNYLEATLYETLRMHPAMMALLKICTKPFVLPSQFDTDRDADTDGRLRSDGDGFTVPQGMVFVVPVKAIHYDASLYPAPLCFQPERFSTPAERQRLGCRFLGFGEGPRMCPGMRFGLAQSKAALATLLRKYTVHLPATTGADSRFEISATTFLTASKHGIWLRLLPRT